MSINIRVGEHLTWGRYFGIYTVYKIDVKYKGDTWIIFRRFSEFTDMHSRFLVDPSLKEVAMPLTELLPEKQHFGSALATLDSVCIERKQKFSQYLESMLQEKALCKSPAFLSFIDVQNKGISGIKRVLGEAQVLREESVVCSQGRLASMGINAWKRSYICVTKKGWIYCTKCVYDTPDECDVKIDLKSKYTRIGGQTSDRVLMITYDNNTNLHIKFDDQASFSSWLRLLSDFSINTAQKDVMKEAPVVKERRQSQPKSHIRDKGTGKTEDDLSAELGI